MTPRIFIERPITSVEDAEGLPVGTVAVRFWGAGVDARSRGPHGWTTSIGGALPHAEVIGFTALVPVEAEEETLAGYAISPDGGADLVHRYVTRWEVAE